MDRIASILNSARDVSIRPTFDSAPDIKSDLGPGADSAKSDIDLATVGENTVKFHVGGDGIVFEASNLNIILTTLLLVLVLAFFFIYFALRVRRFLRRRGEIKI